MIEHEIRYLGEVQRLALKPGDILVLSVDFPIPDEAAERMINYVGRDFPGHKVVVLSDGVRLGVVSPEAA